MSATASARPTLAALQRWFQQVVTDPGGVASGVESAAARQLIPIGRDGLEQVIGRSQRLTAEQRLSVYARAYPARLVECLAESLPMFRRTVGAEVFDDFAFGYLQSYPSQSYTLGRLAENFPRYLQETRPDRDDASATARASWPDLLAEVATFELAIGEVFDGPGVENVAPLAEQQLRAVPPARWPQARLATAPCLKLLRFRYPVNDYYGAMRRDTEAEIPFPQAGESFVGLHRRDYVVRRYPLNHFQFVLLHALQLGCSIAEGIERVTAAGDLDGLGLEASLHAWFQQWTAEGFFTGIEWPR